MANILDYHFNFSHLSLKDLIEARDLFHVHLMSKKNVIATAISRYRIRSDDRYPNEANYLKQSKTKNRSVRSLDNSEVRDYSWPCILVFVSKWQQESDLVETGENDVVPKKLYMPDGRIVPVCVIEAPKQIVVTDEVNQNNVTFPSNYISGGFPVIVESQGIERIASIGCVVTDGNKYFALTNRHVAGESGTEVFTRLGGDVVRVGVTADRQLAKMKFVDLYPEWAGKSLMVNNDVGLIEIDDLNQWKTQVYGIGKMDELADLNTTNFTLDLISTKIKEKNVVEDTTSTVVACGAISGIMKGEVVALFYRYRAIGGLEYVADFLIGGKDGKDLHTHHGDSGTLWMLETKNGNGTLRQPLALQWGQHEFISAGKAQTRGYALATCLSNICRELDVELVRGWNIDQDYSWGKVGHYTIGNKAIDAIRDASLQRLMKNNLENISFPRAGISGEMDDKAHKDEYKALFAGFCPLADVPDIIWKQSKKVSWGRMGDENPNHYADVDAPTIKNGGRLFDICDKENKLSTEIWSAYYKNIDRKKIHLTKPDDPNRDGLISFRVWQIFDYLVDAIKKKKIERFIFGAGVLAHYVGDACQPLHSSYMSNGDPADDKSVQYTAKRDSIHHKKGDVYEKTTNPGDGVHVAYEDHMIDSKVEELMKGLVDVLGKGNSKINKEPVITVDSGRAAGFAVLQLMKKTQEDIKPKEIVETFKSVKGQGDNSVNDALWNEFGDRTIDCIARGCRYLAAIWDGAWKAGGGKHSGLSGNKVKQAVLKALYEDPSELPSKHLDTITPILKK
jgi:hypothetical protein